MPGLLAQALGGGAAHSELGYRGPSSKRQDFGSIEDMAKSLYGRDEKDLFKGRWDEIDESDTDVLQSVSKRLKDDPYKVKVSGRDFFLRSFLPSLGASPGSSDFDGFAGAAKELMPEGMVQDGVLPHPETFFHGGFDSVKGTSSSSVAGAADTYDQGYMPAEDYSQYQDEKDARSAMIRLRQNKKVAHLLVKVGLAAPPSITAAGFDDVPNGPTDLGSDQDLKRTTGIPASGVTHHPRRFRPANLQRPGGPAKTAQASAASSIGSAASPGAGNISTQSTKPAGEQKHLKFNPGKGRKGKPRGAHSDALKVRPYTDGAQYDKIPRGFPELDPKFPNAKVAKMLRRAGLCR